MNAVVTLAIGSFHLQILAISEPVLRRYAKFINSDLVIIRELKVKASDPKFEKFQIFDLLATYERVIFLDIDTLLAPDCPDLFKLFPSSHFGAYFDSNGGNGDADVPGDPRGKEIELFQRRFGYIGWEKHYFNSGVMVISKMHREIFSYENRDLLCKVGRFVDQTHLNYRLQQGRFPWVDIGQKYNHFVALSRSPRLFNSRFSSKILHYAGYSEFYPERNLLSQIMRDHSILYQ